MAIVHQCDVCKKIRTRSESADWVNLIRSRYRGDKYQHSEIDICDTCMMAINATLGNVYNLRRGEEINLEDLPYLVDESSEKVLGYILSNVI